MLRSRGNRLPRVSEPLSFFLYLQPVSSPSPSFSIASSILSPFLCLSNTERTEAVSLPFHHSGSSSVCVCVYVCCLHVYTRWCLFCSISLPPFSFFHSQRYLTVHFFPFVVFLSSSFSSSSFLFQTKCTYALRIYIYLFIFVYV